MGFFRVLKQFLMKIFLTILILLLVFNTNAQTRLRPDKSITSAYAPTVLASWNVTTGNTYIPLLFGKVFSSASTTVTSGATGAAATRELLLQTMITPPLAGQTIASASTISAQVKTNMSSTSSRTGAGKVYIRLMNEDGTIASEIGNATTSNLTATNTNRTYSLTLGSNVVVTGGQRIVFEFGWRYLTGSDVNTTGSINTLSGPAATDLPVDNTTTTAAGLWVEFSQTLIISSGYASGIML